MIRRATIQDLDALVAGNLAMALQTERLALDPQNVRRGVRAVLEGRAPGAYHVLEEDGRVLAQLLVTYDWSDWRNCPVWWIQSVYVPPAHRGLGLFRQLYDHVVDMARAAGAGGIRLYVDVTNTRAQDIYASLGMNGDHYRVFEAMFDEPVGG